MANPLRARLRNALLSGTDAKIALLQRRLDSRAEQLAAQTSKQATRLESLTKRSTKLADGSAALKQSVGRLNRTVSSLNQSASETAAALADLVRRVGALETTGKHRDVELERRSAQIGTLEERLGRIDQTLASQLRRSHSPAMPAGAAAGEAFDLLDSIRKEHEQIRVRMQIVATYEERLRRVEESLISLNLGDDRHQL